ncbi:MAG: PAS domain-containing protein [Alphaproteobacteria bacterium]|nr:PAS domain-containing protein [Alphaproteobacteria bacterium]
MKIRSQILIAQLPTAFIISLITLFFIFLVFSIKHKSESILIDNFKSIIAMERINESLEKLTDFYLKESLLPPPDILKVKLWERTIEQQLMIQDRNIQESEERELTNTLHEKWETYKKVVLSFPINTPYLKNIYNGIRSLTKNIIDLNQDDLILTKDNLSQFISDFLRFIIFGSIVSLIFGFFMSWFFTGIFLSPLKTMAETMRQVGKEDKATFLHIKGSDEIDVLCNEFNFMISRLKEYHQGSLGKVIQDYQILKSILDNLPDGIILLDQETNITYINKPAQKLLGFVENFKKIPSLFHVEEHLRETLLKISAKVFMTKAAYVPEKEEDSVEIYKKNQEMTFSIWAYPIKKSLGNGYNELEGVVVVFQNLLSKPLSVVDKSDVYEALVHEFQSALTEIHMSIHLCVEEVVGTLTEKQKEILVVAREKCVFLEKLCQELLNLSLVNGKARVLEQREIDLNEVVSNLAVSLRLEADQKKIFISVEEAPYLSKIKANENQIAALIGNLLHNAIHYAYPETSVKIKIKENNKFIELSINNQGPFIPFEYRKDIFKKHFKVPGQSDKRAGLGLYIAKQITQLMGGKIGFRSTEKQGTTFWVALPVLQEKV